MFGFNGTITSPNYPEHYLNNLNCVWTVAVPIGHVSIEFLDFELESNPTCTDYDFVQIRQAQIQLTYSVWSAIASSVTLLTGMHKHARALKAITVMQNR